MNKLRVGITGYTGFIGIHLVERLSREADIAIVKLDDNLFNNQLQLTDSLKTLDCVVHLAGMNRGEDQMIYDTNVKLATMLVTGFEQSDVNPHLIFASSILSKTDTAFGRSKDNACTIFESWAKKHIIPVSLLDIANVFGDRGRPFYNSVIATFCFQLTHGQEPKIIDDREIELIYINDLVEIILQTIKQPPALAERRRINGTRKLYVSQILALIEKFKDFYYKKKVVPHFADRFEANLYNVFLSYMDPKDFSCFPEVHKDQRGELLEIIKLAEGGQIFFSVSKPGVTRGNHYHTRKIERFSVLRGEAIIRLRRIGTKEVTEFRANSRQPQFIEVPIFHAHNIENIGGEDLLTLFWCNELFDPADPDTFIEEV